MSNTSVTTPASEPQSGSSINKLPTGVVTMVRPVFDNEKPFIEVRFQGQDNRTHVQRYFFTQEVNARISKSELESALKAPLGDMLFKADAFIGMEIRYEQLEDAISDNGQRTYEQFRLYPVSFALNKEQGARFLAKISQLIG